MPKQKGTTSPSGVAATAVLRKRGRPTGVVAEASAGRKRRVMQNQLPETLPAGEILTDVGKGQWRLGNPIGVGGFGRIYTASNDVSLPVPNNAPFVIKMEPHGNGPLFTEMHFYHRAAKSETIEAWKKMKKLKFLGMPKFVASGSCEYNTVKYRFMVMERFGCDLQRLFELNKKKFTVKTVFTVGIKVIDILEYIHSTGYIHADIKGSNLLLGLGKRQENEVYLVDFGLACKFASEGKHKPFHEDPRKAHDGTIEFTSRDAHVGAHSRRGDFEILAYNMLQWLCGRLPWEDNLKDPVYVSQSKNKYMSNVPSLMKTCFKKTPYPESIERFFEYVVSLRFDEQPDYSRCKNLFAECLQENGLVNDGKLDIIASQSPKRRGGKQVVGPDDDENSQSEIPRKQPRSNIRKPCGLAQTNHVKKPSPRQKKNGELKDAMVDGQVPTPAMLQVLQLKRQREQKLKQKGDNSSLASTRTPSPVRHSKRRQNLRRSSHSLDSKRCSTSPDLF